MQPGPPPATACGRASGTLGGGAAAAPPGPGRAWAPPGGALGGRPAGWQRLGVGTAPAAGPRGCRLRLRPRLLHGGYRGARALKGWPGWDAPFGEGRTGRWALWARSEKARVPGPCFYALPRTPSVASPGAPTLAPKGGSVHVPWIATLVPPESGSAETDVHAFFPGAVGVSEHSGWSVAVLCASLGRSSGFGHQPRVSGGCLACLCWDGGWHQEEGWGRVFIRPIEGISPRLPGWAIPPPPKAIGVL